jgi:hypothetical protein
MFLRVITDKGGGQATSGALVKMVTVTNIPGLTAKRHSSYYDTPMGTAVGTGVGGSGGSSPCSVKDAETAGSVKKGHVACLLKVELSKDERRIFPT